VTEQRNLAEKLTGAERVHDVTALDHLDVTLDDGVERVAPRPLVDQHGAGRVAFLERVTGNARYLLW
jgi:hypothetical protein